MRSREQVLVEPVNRTAAIGWLPAELPSLSSLLLGFVVLGATSGCTGTDTGNPFTKPVVVDAHSSDMEEVSLQLGGATSVSTLWVGFGSMVLLGGDTCSEVLETVDLGVVELAGDQRLNRQARLESEAICGVELSLARSSGQEGEPDLIGNSVLVRGRSVSDTPFQITLPREENVLLQVIGGEFFIENDGAHFFVGLDVATLLGGIDIDSAVLDASGTIQIGPSANPSLFQELETSFPRSLVLYNDVDGDGEAGASDEKLAQIAR